MEQIRDVIFLVKSKGFSWKTYHEDESGLFDSRNDELHVLIDSPEDVPTLTPRMLKLIETVRDKSPHSIKDLALLLKEDYGNTNRLCHELNRYGLLDLEPQDDKPKSKMKPVVPYEHFSLTVISTDSFIAKRHSKKKSA